MMEQPKKEDAGKMVIRINKEFCKGCETRSSARVAGFALSFVPRKFMSFRKSLIARDTSCLE
jgi:hypothetical protein